MTVRYLTIFGLFLLLAGTHEATAQSSRDSESSAAATKSAEKMIKSKTKVSKKGNFYKKGQEDRLIEEYEQLLKSNKKKYRKMAKGMKKPQYSDPTYFGHKRPPKKRKLGKRKFCKECGMIH